MHDIQMDSPSRDFLACWVAAGKHIELKAQESGSEIFWLKADPYPPFLAHLSFRLGNQLFFVRVEDASNAVPVPGNRGGLLRISEGCAGHPCVLSMRHQQGEWIPDGSAWSLMHAATGQVIDPPSEVTGDPIVMTDWELLDFAVDVVKKQLVKDKRKVMSSQSDPEVDPSIWYVGNQGPEWVVVRAARYPIKDAPKPKNLPEIIQSCSRLSEWGHFASVAVANARDPFNPEKGPLPLWRGGGMYVSYQGLEPITYRQFNCP